MTHFDALLFTYINVQLYVIRSNPLPVRFIRIAFHHNLGSLEFRDVVCHAMLFQHITDSRKHDTTLSGDDMVRISKC